MSLTSDSALRLTPSASIRSMDRTPSGFPCPQCGSPSLVYTTKQHANVDGWSTRRYRKCDRCQNRFITVELLLIKERDL